MTSQFKRAAYAALEASEDDPVVFQAGPMRYKWGRRALKRALYEERRIQKLAKRASQ